MLGAAFGPRSTRFALRARSLGHPVTIASAGFAPGAAQIRLEFFYTLKKPADAQVCTRSVATVSAEGHHALFDHSVFRFGSD